MALMREEGYRRVGSIDTLPCNAAAATRSPRDVERILQALAMPEPKLPSARDLLERASRGPVAWLSSSSPDR